MNKRVYVPQVPQVPQSQEENNSNKNETWIACSNCGKKLLKRRSNGMFIFKFGKNQQGGDVVHIEVMGSIRVKCFRASCQHVNELLFFPKG